MKYFSMFSGIGGFELGVARATNKQWECVGHCEIDKYATAIYRKNFGIGTNYGDATRIFPDELPSFDFLCGGFPCQAFSIAGKRGGFKDTRGTLFFEIARILAVKRPELLLLENVAGLLSHDNGRTFGTILATLSELGYFCEWQVLNSKDFGVPQNRERVFIVGHLGEVGGGQVFPITENDELLNSSTKAGTTLQAGYGTRRDDQYLAIPVLTPDRAEKRQNGRRMQNDGEPAFTLTAQDKHGVFDGYRIRRLTPTECERLQSFPDGWTSLGVSKDREAMFTISDSQRYKCLGNAVTVNVIEAIISKITKCKNCT